MGARQRGFSSRLPFWEMCGFAALLRQVVAMWAGDVAHSQQVLLENPLCRRAQTSGPVQSSGSCRKHSGVQDVSKWPLSFTGGCSAEQLWEELESSRVCPPCEIKLGEQAISPPGVR